MFGAFFGKHKEDVKPVEDSQTAYTMLDGKEVGKPKEGVDDDKNFSTGRFGLALLSEHLFRPKTYERLVHDLYVAGWSIDEVKTLLNGGKIDE